MPPPPRKVSVQEEQPAPKATPASEAAPRAMVTSAMNAATRQEAQDAIGAVNKRLAGADTDAPANRSGEELNLVRKLRDGAQQAFDEQDYLTARSLAQKALVLADQLKPTSQQPESR